MKQQTESKEVQAVNRAFERVSKELSRFASDCLKAGSPVRSVMWRINDLAETKCHVTYQKVKAKT